ncbi:MAG TPA: hypothetical protein VIZ28_02960, partial [Chitinophagaceae bacterium]
INSLVAEEDAQDYTDDVNPCGMMRVTPMFNSLQEGHIASFWVNKRKSHTKVIYFPAGYNDDLIPVFVKAGAQKRASLLKPVELSYQCFISGVLKCA